MQPYFSIVIPVYNREGFIKRCLDSCLSQTFSDFEIVVVDDGSIDNTLNILENIQDSRIRIVRHAENQGILAARFTGRTHAAGKWIVHLDSDWELFLFALQRLYEITSNLDENIVGVRARQILDTGKISPPFLPREPIIDYIGRIKYMEMGGGYDVLGCYPRKIFDQLATYPECRGGAGAEFLEILNLHQQGLMLHVEDILCKQYTNAPNSVTRGNVKSRVKDLKTYAPDMLWMYEEAMRLHGGALEKFAPNQYIHLIRKIALQHLYLGHRRQGLREMLKYLGKKPYDIATWGTLFLGLMSPNLILYGNAVRHMLRSTRSRHQKRYPAAKNQEPEASSLTSGK